MSQIMTRTGIGIAMISLAVMLTACGSSTANSKNVFNNEERHGGGSEAGEFSEITWHVGAARADLNSCKECHGDDLSGGISKVACSSCHVNGITPTTMTGCISCHANPPSGATAPNRAGAHAIHDALANVTGVCNTCHNNAGSGMKLHNDGITEVDFLSVYSAKSGTAVHNADGTCSNVSCHGGQTTPVWGTGTIDVNNQCTSCHAFAFSYDLTQYNNYSSGQHYFHVVVKGMPCFTCHDTTKLATNHFTSLNTHAMEGPASATIQDTMYNPATFTCAVTCHDARVW
jgi:predicted CxxxxCH...CXXCH cytochrome family protein